MISAEYYDEVQQWFVVFQARTRPRTRLIHYLLHDDFVHCLLVRSIGDKTLVIDPLQWGVGVKVYDEPADQFIVNHSHQASAILSYVADYRRLDGYIPRGVYTCVTLIKGILGIKKAAFIQTPFALYLLMLRYETTTIVKPFIPYMRERND